MSCGRVKLDYRLQRERRWFRRAQSGGGVHRKDVTSWLLRRDAAAGAVKNQGAEVFSADDAFSADYWTAFRNFDGQPKPPPPCFPPDVPLPELLPPPLLVLVTPVVARIVLPVPPPPGLPCAAATWTVDGTDDELLIEVFFVMCFGGEYRYAILCRFFAPAAPPPA